VQFASDQKRKEDDAHIWLKGRDEPISVSLGDDKESLSAFFVLLDSGAEFDAFPGFVDIDGEYLRFNAAEIVMATAPRHVLNEGFRDLAKESDSEPGDRSKGIPF